MLAWVNLLANVSQAKYVHVCEGSLIDNDMLEQYVCALWFRATNPNRDIYSKEEKTDADAVIHASRRTLTAHPEKGWTIGGVEKSWNDMVCLSDPWNLLHRHT